MLKRAGGLVIVLAVLFAPFGPAVSASAPTPVAGGANQTGGVNGMLSGIVFNGRWRLKNMSLRDAVPADDVRPNAPDTRALVLRYTVSNGTHSDAFGYFNSSIVDADGITIDGRPIEKAPWDLQPGAAARAANAFSLPANFVPVRIVLIEAGKRNPVAFRIAIGPNDLIPAPQATPSR